MVGLPLLLLADARDRSADRRVPVDLAALGRGTNGPADILGGGMERAGDLILEPIKRMVRRLAFEEPASMVRIIPSRLGENAVALGSASLVIREIFIHA